MKTALVCLLAVLSLFAHTNLCAQETAEVYVYVYHDVDPDCVYVPFQYDLDVAGAEISLFDESGVLETVTTGPEVIYTFTVPAPGTYRVTVTPPQGYTPQTLCVGETTEPPGSSQLITVSPGQSYALDFPVDWIPPAWAYVYGIVYEDENGDGVRQPLEKGLAGIPVYQYEAPGEAGKSYGNTNQHGFYYVFIAAPHQVDSLTVTVAGPPGPTPTPSEITLEINGGNAYSADFGLPKPEDTVLDVTSFEDANMNGVQDASEVGLPGVNITLFDGTLAFDSEVTGADGTCSFEVLPWTEVRIVQDMPPGYFMTTSTAAQVIVPHEGYQVRFGNAAIDSGKAFIHGRVFVDTDHDGSQGPPELGIQGVTITGGGSAKNTNNDGFYFLYVDAPATYTVTEVDLAGYNSTTPNAVIVDVASESSYEVNFGDASSSTPEAVIYGRVFDDLDHDGVQDLYEAGIESVTVAAGGASTITNHSGSYSLAVSAPGVHTVWETNPGGYQSTTPDEVEVEFVTAGAHRVDFGDSEAFRIVIAGNVYEDVNGNGTQDAGESGLPGVSVDIHGPLHVPDNTDTDPDGTFTFITTIPGSYLVEVNVPSGYWPTTATAWNLAAGLGHESSRNVGLEPLGPAEACIHGTVFEDMNADGMRDPEDIGLSAVTVTATPPGGPVQTATTGALGAYAFTVGTPADHVVVETNPPGYRSSSPDTIAVSAETGQVHRVDFAEVPDSLGTQWLHCRVLEDPDENGHNDHDNPGPPIPGALITVTDDRGVTYEDSTDVDGKAVFAVSVPARFTVVETNLPGYRSTTPDTVTLSIVDPGDFRTANVLFLDATPYPADIHGTVFNDSDGDGEMDSGEAGIPGVTVEASGDSATTDSDGNYSLAVQTPATYEVIAWYPPGYYATTPNTVMLDVEPEGSYEIDFGFRDMSTVAFIFGAVFDDMNENAIRDAGETGLGGVTVITSGDSAVTDLNGMCTVIVDSAGTHEIIEINPSGYKSTTPDTVMLAVELGGQYEIFYGDALIDTALVYGTVFDDKNANGVRDSSEVGLPGVTVSVYGDSGSVNFTATDSAGGYSFTVDAPANYTVVETNPDGYLSTTPDTVTVICERGPEYRVNFGDEREVTDVLVDLKPGTCPNSINPKSRGVIPVAIVGTEEFDVTQIDPATLRLAGVAPKKWSLEDVSTPFEPADGISDCMDCSAAGPDGYTDLTLKFKTQEVIQALGEPIQENCVPLLITGSLLDGGPIEGQDIMSVPGNRIPGSSNSDASVSNAVPATNRWGILLLVALATAVGSWFVTRGAKRHSRRVSTR